MAQMDLIPIFMIKNTSLTLVLSAAVDNSHPDRLAQRGPIRQGTTERREC